ncbi:MAG TPA: flagellar hook-associated protein FlgK [bacterium]|nr:flagellar hook-associated protein FlgK [bacterium]HOL46789.1 flagellar hook-associated protein FlgK [bacterium]HPQ17744.1 flagellar hook-associated protein FlgK [bacterium]
MPSFFGIETARKSLMAHQYAIEVTGHNIANAGNENYSRQRVIMDATDPMYPPGFYNSAAIQKIGSGVIVSQIERIRDAFIDNRIIKEDQSLGYWNKMNELMHQIELIYNEPSDSSLRSVLDSFWEAWNDVANAETPGEITATREIVIQRGIALSATVNSIYSSFQTLAGSGGYAGGDNAIDAEIKVDVEKINSIGAKIAALNQEIAIADISGNPANDLLDKRDALVKEIANLVDVRVVNTDTDDYRVIAGGVLLVQGVNYNEIEVRRDEVSKRNFIFQKGTDIQMNVSNGELKALFEVRDEYLPQHMNNLNEFAITFTDIFNEQHRYGFGLDGSTGVNFFNPIPTGSDSIRKIIGTRYINSPTEALNGDLTTNEYENFESLISRSSSARVSNSPPESAYINVNASFATNKFKNPLNVNTSITIETNKGTWTSPLLSTYTSVKELMEDIAYNLEGVELVYDRNTDKFSIIGYPDITYIKLTESDANGLWSAINIDASTDATRINKITDSTSIKSGRIGINGYYIDYNADTDSINDVINRINATNCGVRASLTPEGRFVLRATADSNYTIRSLTDSGTLLTTLGVLAPGRGYTLADGNTYNLISTNIEYTPLADAAYRFSVNEEVINNTDKIAAQGGVDTNLDGILDVPNGPADGSNAFALASLKSRNIMNAETTTFNDFFNGLISKLGVSAQVAKTQANNYQNIVDNLKSLQQSISGVSLDEEMANLIKYQKGYSATGRFVAVIQEMMDSVLGMVR